ncbi:hypothetical protein [Ancylobacter dichloromethanicus]|uniref:hypothetical protein n=1 Tax=Ancylobacter dichloromethanicus TaxID=518825 RepID=UPI0036216537
MSKTSNLIDDIHLVHPALGESADWFPHLEMGKDSGEFAGLRNRVLPLVERAGTEIMRGNSAEASNYIGLATVVDATKARKYLGSSGILRASKYNFGIKGPLDVVERLLKGHPAINASPICKLLDFRHALTDGGERGRETEQVA